MVLLKIAFNALLEKEQEFHQALDTLSGVIPGLKTCRQIVGMGGPEEIQFSLVQEFSSRDSLIDFASRDSFKQLIGALMVLGQIVEAKMYTSISSEPLENIIGFLKPGPAGRSIK